MRGRPSQITLTLVCLLLGAALVVQFRTQGNIVKSILVDSTTEQATITNGLVESNASLRKEIDSLDTQLVQYQKGDPATDMQSLVNDLNQTKVVNGTIEVSGPGIQLILTGTLAPEELQDIINEIRNAGAEAIVLNGQRVVVNSAVVQGTSGPSLDGMSVQPPYRFEAIGDPETLQVAIDRKGGLVPLLVANHPGLRMNLSMQAKIVAPIDDRKMTFRYAQPVNQ